MKEEKSCGSIIVKDNKILLIKHHRGDYGFPKGHMEYGETEEETAIRETKEETNIDVIIDKSKRYEIDYMTSKNTHKTAIYFLASPQNDIAIPQTTEIAEILWVDIDKVKDYLQFENIIKLWDDRVIKDIYNNG